MSLTTMQFEIVLRLATEGPQSKQDLREYVDRLQAEQERALNGQPADGGQVETAANTMIGTQAIVVHIHRLRAKLEDHPSRPVLLLTQYHTELKQYQYTLTAADCVVL